MKKVSVCIVTYNNENDILNVLNSIYKNTFSLELEVFVVDSNSQDNTVKLVQTNFPQVKVIPLLDNKGFGSGHNKVIDKITSDFHVIMNPDITFSENVLKYLADYLSENEDVALVSPKILNEDGSEQYLPKRTPKFKYLISSRLEKFGKIFKKWRSEYVMSNIIVDKPINVDFCTGCFIMIKTSLFKRLGGFDEQFFMYFEDADLVRRAQNYGKTMFNPLISVTHRWGRRSSKQFKYFCIHVSSMFKYFIKWK